MAGKLIANLIVIGSTYLARGLIEGYRKALASHYFITQSKAMIDAQLIPSQMQYYAKQSGVAQETLQNVRKGSKTMTEQEARQILGASMDTSWEEVLKKYDTLFERNAKVGSFYLQSKVHRAKECLETVYGHKDQESAGGEK